MKRLIAYVSGNVQKVGYRAKVIDIARAFGIKGTIENLSDGRVKIIAEGDDEKLKWFESAIDIKNTLVQVSSIDKRSSQADGEFSGFNKIVEKEETDSRLDKGIEIMTKMLVAIENVDKTLCGVCSNIKDVNKTLVEMNSNLGGKMDQMLQKQDIAIQKQDQMLSKQDVMI
jgi:acylphosphatase